MTVNLMRKLSLNGAGACSLALIGSRKPHTPPEGRLMLAKA